jgi:hypothetical protein
MGMLPCVEVLTLTWVVPSACFSGDRSPNCRNFYKLTLRLANEIGLGGYPGRQIGYKKKKLGPGNLPAAGDSKMYSSLGFAMVAPGKHIVVKGTATPAG